MSIEIKRNLANDVEGGNLERKDEYRNLAKPSEMISEMGVESEFINIEL